MDSNIQIVIQSPRGQKSFSFEKTTKIAEVVETARTAFGFEPGSFSLKRESTGEVLAPERPLVSYHVKDGEVLLLVPEMGSGV
jgi:hypothetical protein